MTGIGAGEESQTRADSAPYPYMPLDFDTHEIRVLSLHINDINDEIRCSIRTMSLIEPKPYYALSYCWGSRDMTRKILLELKSETAIKATAIVTENLWLALKAVRKFVASLDKKSAVISLWVDAMCINQNDNQERSQQVRNMRQIYSRAEEVFSWVGSGSRPAGVLDPTMLLSIQRRFGVLNLVPKLPLDFDQENALDMFFNEEYWRRVWVVQEITVATKVTILYGEHDFQWEDIATILRQIQKLEPAQRQLPGYHSTAVEAAKGVVHLLKFRDGYTGRNLISLFEALIWSRRALATDPRDKIFALLGLCHDGATFVPVPNYKQDLGTIIADMSRAMMSLNKSLDCICLRGARKLSATENLPR